MLERPAAASAQPPRCPCGFTKFGERVEKVLKVAQSRWRPIQGSGAGVGAAPFGTSFASGAALEWGRYSVDVVTGKRSMFCLRCGRVRRSTPVGAGIVMQVWSEGTTVRALMTDVVDPNCMEAHFTSDSGLVVTAPVESESANLLSVPASTTPLELRAALSPAAVLPTHIFSVVIPDDLEAGQYRLVLHDRCLGTMQELVRLGRDAVETLYGRSGHVVGVLGDYSAGQVTHDAGTVAEAVEEVAEGVDAIPMHAGALGGTLAAPQVTALRFQRDLPEEDPPDGAELVYSVVEGRWRYTIAPRLAPTLYSPVAQYALNALAPEGLYHDRSGNARHIASGTGQHTLDLIPGSVAFYDGYLTSNHAALRLQSSFTATFRVKFRVRPDGGHQCFFDGSGVGLNTNYLVATFPDGRLYFSHTPRETFVSNLYLPIDTWAFVAVRRSILGVTLTVDDFSESNGVPGFPLNAAAPLFIGAAEGTDGSRAISPFADLSLWSFGLTDPQLLTIRKPMMGLA